MDADNDAGTLAHKQWAVNSSGGVGKDLSVCFVVHTLDKVPALK